MAKELEKGLLKKTKPNSEKYGTCKICGCELGKYHMDGRGGLKFCSFKCADEFSDQQTKNEAV